MFRFVMAAAVMALPALAVDGTTLINQSTVMAAGGFPYHVTQSGSYKLSGNLVSNGPGLLITAPNVALDLNGFTISCSASCGSTGIGSTANGTTVMNGTVTGFSTAGGAGINLSGSGATVDRVNVINNSVGITSNGPDLVVTNCKLSNGTFGIIGATTTSMLNSTLSGFVGDGVQILNGVITGNTITGNGSVGGPGTAGGGALLLISGGSVNITNNLFVNNKAWNLNCPSGNCPSGYGLNTFVGGGVSGGGVASPYSMGNNVCAGGGSGGTC